MQFNVREPPYNAAGDGVTDDTAAINAAISDAEADGGGTVYIPAGTYKTSDTIVHDDDKSLVIHGDGPEGTILKYTGSATAVLIKGRFRAALRDLQVNCTTSAATGLQIEDCARCIIENVFVDGDPATALKMTTQGIHNTVHNHLRNLELRGAGRALWLNAAVAGSWVNANTFENVVGRTSSSSAVALVHLDGP